MHPQLRLTSRAAMVMDYPAAAAELHSHRTMDDVDVRVRAAVARHLGLVWRVLRRAGLRPADADDASQDVFWVLARRHHEVPERSERAFLVATALRVASDRRRSKWHRSVLVPLEDEVATQGASPDERADARRMLARLDRALQSLDDAERAVFVLLDVEEFSKREAAEVLAIPEGTVASRLRRARIALKAALALEEETAGES